MNKEKEYYSTAKKDVVKKYGQYFTPSKISDFMAQWVSKNAKTVLDPAVGNSIFFNSIRNYNTTAKLYGYEIDEGILNYFGNNYNIKLADYLLSDWESNKYDAIICNPPYNRFQTIDNRVEIRKCFEKNTNLNINGYTNQAILFLMKSIFELKENGKIAYIIPTDFLESNYGLQIKKMLLENKLLYALINLDFNVFENATTTSCILLLEKVEKDSCYFLNIKNIDDLDTINFTNLAATKYNMLNINDKWLNSICKSNSTDYKNLTKMNKYVKVSRGIATGCNEFFLFDKNDVSKNNIPTNCFTYCISKSADIKNSIFKDDTLNDLIEKNKKVFLLNINDDCDNIHLNNYIKLGEEEKINEKYLLKTRTPWFSMEQKKSSPIWITNANRGRIKVIRNLTNTSNLTTFHSVFVNEKYDNLVNVIFCYLMTDIAQEIIKQNKKTMGGGLDKYQPSDLNNAYMLNLDLLSDDDISSINDIYNTFIEKGEDDKSLAQLNSIFSKYILT